jgi:hypothetical protein
MTDLIWVLLEMYGEATSILLAKLFIELCVNILGSWMSEKSIIGLGDGKLVL